LLEEGREGLCAHPGPRPAGGVGDGEHVGATTAQILALREHLLAAKVSCVVIGSTSDYWKPFYYLLDDELDVVLVNAARVRNIPGRKTDISDAAWLADLGADGLVKASFVPPAPAVSKSVAPQPLPFEYRGGICPADRAMGPFSVSYRAGFDGWSTAELYVLNRYRERAR
jgi:hypothetical protein